MEGGNGRPSRRDGGGGKRANSDFNYYLAQLKGERVMIKHLQDYKSKFGNLLVPSRYKIHSTGKTINLGTWVHQARNKHNKGCMKDELKQTLDSMGFVWNAFDHSNDEMIHHLQEYKSQFGNLLVPQRYKIQSCGNTINLGEWVNGARQKYRRGEMKDELKQTLDSMGFVWNTRDSSNDEMIQHLQEYKSKFGNLLVPQRYKIESGGNTINLGVWVNNARQKYKGNETEDDLKQTLDSMGFVWKIKASPLAIDSDDMIQHLQEYKSKFGNLLVPQSCKIQSCGKTINLGSWVDNARQNHRKGKMKGELKQTLDSIGFVWKVNTNSDEMIQHLQEYKSQFGNLLVPDRYKIQSCGKTINLGYWVSWVRKKNRKGVMEDELKQSLDSIGFVWNARACPKKRSRLAMQKSYKPPMVGTSESIGDRSTQRKKITCPDEDSVSSASDDIGAPSSFHTPEAKRKKFWRPPTPYPVSDDEEGF